MSMTFRRRTTSTRRLALRLDRPLLSRDDERRLFRKMRALRSRADRLRRRIERLDGGAIPNDRLTDANPPGFCLDVARIDGGSGGEARRRKDLLKARLASLDGRANVIRNEIAERNLRLVVSFASKAATPEFPLEDLVGDCLLPLLRAVELYDPDQGCGFSTYATHAVRNAIGRAMKRSAARSRREGGVDGRPLDSLRDDRTNEAILTAEHAVDVALASRLLDGLGSRERTILEARFGLGAFSREHTFQEIGGMLRLSKERVRILAHRTIEHLQSVTRCAAWQPPGTMS